jgi:AcrR family transcriptional regulator
VCAQELTEERGLEGFTMEELAEASGVSRRTLFNYFPSKIDAVLGDSPELSEEALQQFRARGAGSNLVSDLRDLANELLDAPQVNREDVARSRRVLRGNPRLLAAAHDRFLVLTGQIVEEIRSREGAGFDASRAQIAVRLLCALFDAALDSFLADPHERPLADAYEDVLRAARQLLV